MATLLAVVALLAVAAHPPDAHAATFNPTTPAELITAIDTANANGEDDTIDLGGRTFALFNGDGNENGLPIIGSDGGRTLTIQNGAIRREPIAAAFRPISVGSGANLTLQDVTVSGGNASIGGGILIVQGTLILIDSTLLDNAASGSGGGLYNLGGTLEMTGSNVRRNTAGQYGGGLFSVLQATTTITDSAITNNTALLEGGGIFVDDRSSLTISDSTVADNHADEGGGGIATDRTSTVIVNGSAISGNVAAGGLGGGVGGGGIRNDFNSSVTINGTVITDNLALGSAAAGGGIANLATLIVNDSTISENAAFQGGAIANDNNGTLTVTNSTVSGNTASSRGGAVHQLTGTATFRHTTFSGNAAPDGGGIFRFTGPVTLRASILDTGTSGANCSGTMTSLGSNLSDDASCAFAQTGDQNSVATLNLGPLAENGGLTQTHALLPGSAALDAVQGSCSTTGDGGGITILLDQRGTARAKDGDGNGTATCDAGAFERAPGTLQLSSATATAGEGVGSVVVTITRTGGADGPVGATVTPSAGTATAPDDFAATPLVVSFAAGDAANKTVSLPIVGDALDENDETINLTLGGPTGGATLGSPSAAVLTVTDDDPLPTVSIGNVAQAEGNSGTTAFAFPVTLSAASGRAVTAAYTTAAGAATSGTDFTAASGIVTFAPGDTSETISVAVVGDTLFEAGEAFTVTLTNPTNATLGTAQAVGLIQNDDVLAACTPRPRVTPSLAAGGGVLQVRVEATPLNTQQNNPLKSLTFTQLDNATVTFNGQPVAAGGSVTLPPNTYATTFTVQRASPGLPATAHLTIEDGCGSWTTFVGGGTSAGF